MASSRRHSSRRRDRSRKGRVAVPQGELDFEIQIAHDVRSGLKRRREALDNWIHSIFSRLAPRPRLSKFLVCQQPGHKQLGPHLIMGSSNKRTEGRMELGHWKVWCLTKGGTGCHHNITQPMTEGEMRQFPDLADALNIRKMIEPKQRVQSSGSPIADIDSSESTSEVHSTASSPDPVTPPHVQSRKRKFAELAALIDEVDSEDRGTGTRRFDGAVSPLARAELSSNGSSSTRAVNTPAFDFLSSPYPSDGSSIELNFARIHGKPARAPSGTVASPSGSLSYSDSSQSTDGFGEIFNAPSLPPRYIFRRDNKDQEYTHIRLSDDRASSISYGSSAMSESEAEQSPGLRGGLARERLSDRYTGSPIKKARTSPPTVDPSPTASELAVAFPFKHDRELIVATSGIREMREYDMQVFYPTVDLTGDSDNEAEEIAEDAVIWLSVYTVSGSPWPRMVKLVAKAGTTSIFFHDYNCKLKDACGITGDSFLILNGGNGDGIWAPAKWWDEIPVCLDGNIVLKLDDTFTPFDDE